ncbi:MAG: GNAT family N-acetyltransferase [Betaproteobacteria bacterium]|nr:GNAT family N-acetyltransferase [Betaproteobacteria bacterium]
MNDSAFRIASISDNGLDGNSAIHQLGHQSWTAANLCIPSFHGDLRYFTTRWDALCPYVEVSLEMLDMAARPLLIYALPPECDWGHPIKDAYGLVDVRDPLYWTLPKRAKKFKELRQKHSQFIHSIDLVPGSSLSEADLYRWGSEHFSRFEINPSEISGFVDYVSHLDVLVIRVDDINGSNVLTDVSILLPERGQVYGSFCQWNPAYRASSPGLYACLLAAQWARDNGYEVYNLGPVGAFPYKRLFVNRVEPIFSLALCPADHPLAQDKTSPLFSDFRMTDWNKLRRGRRYSWRAEKYLFA